MSNILCGGHLKNIKRNSFFYLKLAEGEEKIVAVFRIVNAPRELSMSRKKNLKNRYAL